VLQPFAQIANHLRAVDLVKDFVPSLWTQRGQSSARAGIDYGNFRVTGFVNNVFDTDYRRTVFALGSTASDFPGTPRIYGAKVGYKF
jgi:outer membrane receptor protein involved in Fe transport